MTWLFTSALILSSGLLFLAEPMCAKMLLPVLGGTPAVWNTCMVFFQAGLLLGYCYAHLGTGLLHARWQVVVHLLVMVLALLSLPVAIPRAVDPPASPTTWLIQTLVAAVGLPFFVLASSGPLLQRWFTRARSCRDPYFLYAAGNLGSFAALVSYPLIVEPYLSLQDQTNFWTAGYLTLIGLSLACAVCVLATAGRHGHERPACGPSSAATCQPTKGPPVAAQVGVAPPIRLGWGTRLRWVLLALVPSSLMLSVTTYLTTDIAAIPLLWVIPLGIYLLTFTLVFARTQWVSHLATVRWMPLVVVVLALMIFLEGTEPVFVVLGLHLLGLFWLAMVCHGELARTRPAAERLTEFYLWLALGGAVGGLFNAIVAPLLFNSLVEYPLMIAMACVLRPAPSPSKLRPKLDFGVPLLVGGMTLVLVLAGKAIGLEPGPVSVAAFFALPLILVYSLQNYPVRFGLGLALVFLAGALYGGVHGPASYRQRSFFGIHRVTEQDGFRKLFHGNILHGQQSLEPGRRREPLTYYYRTGPIGQVLTSLQGDERLQRVGLIGLGTGALASYAQPGQHWTFFEIDPAVAHIAGPGTGLFTYLRDSRGSVDVVLGDARLTLSQCSDKFGVLVVDAFGSDAIPLHLLTREALGVYMAHLEGNGILAWHISNRYVNLEPILANLAADARPKLVCLIQEDRALSEQAKAKGYSPSIWVLMARDRSHLEQLAANPNWKTARAQFALGVWKDDFSNLASILRFGE